MAERGPIVPTLLEEIAWIHASLISTTEELDDDLVREHPGARAPSIGFHLWHMARWADVFHARLPGFAPELGAARAAR
jgi:uncharacterized damage-inducible protein DinB